jgi:hypothetical protein
MEWKGIGGLMVCVLVAVPPVVAREDDGDKDGRAVIEEQKLTQAVEHQLRRARHEMAADPDGAFDTLRGALLRVKDHPDLGDATRDRLVTRLQAALRETTIRGLDLKIKMLELNQAIEVDIARAGRIHVDDPMKANRLLRSRILQVREAPGISESHRATLLGRLADARAQLARGR